MRIAFSLVLIVAALIGTYLLTMLGVGLSQGKWDIMILYFAWSLFGPFFLLGTFPLCAENVPRLLGWLFPLAAVASIANGVTSMPTEGIAFYVPIWVIIALLCVQVMVILLAHPTRR